MQKKFAIKKIRKIENISKLRGKNNEPNQINIALHD